MIILKKSLYALFLTLFLTFTISSLIAQDKSERLSPPKIAEQTVNNGSIVIDYSSPAQKDRVIWGELVSYGKIWRTGANEATTITFEKDVTIDGKNVKAGKYALFSIPGEKEWKFILNSVWDQWGAMNYDPRKNVAEFSGTVSKRKTPMERMEFSISPKGLVTLSWADVDVSFDID